MAYKLIINADDLGYTPGINDGILLCAREGILTSATIMANGAAFDDALAKVRQARENATAPDIGVHLVLTELPPLSRAGDIPGLTSRNGLLPASPSALVAGVLEGRIRRGTLVAELDRQVGRVLENGVIPTHLDSHKHVHAFPPVLAAVVEVARRYGINYIRSPFDETTLRFAWNVLEPTSHRTLLTQHAGGRLIECFRPFFSPILRRAGLSTPDHFFGVSLTGLWTEKALLRLLSRLPRGLSEIMVHPGHCDDALRRMHSRLQREREQERDALLSPAVRHKVRERGIQPTHFGDITP